MAQTLLPIRGEKRTLTLDFATITGWAIVTSSGKLLDSGVVKFSKDLQIRITQFTNWLDSMIKRFKVSLLVYEEPFLKYLSAAISGYSLRAGCWIAAARYGIKTRGVTPLEVKKFAAGSSNASKERMIRAAKRRWGLTPIDDNHADALCIADWWLESVDTKSKLLPFNK